MDFNMDWKSFLIALATLYVIADVNGSWISAVERMFARWMVRKGEK